MRSSKLLFIIIIPNHQLVLVDSGRMFSLVYSPWERVTTSHHGSQVSLFLLLTGTVLSFSIFTVPNNAVFWITSNFTFTLIRFMYSLKLTDMAPRAPITTGTTITFCICQTFAISSFNLSVLLINKHNVWSSCSIIIINYQLLL